MKKTFILLVFLSLSVHAQNRSYFEFVPFTNWVTNPVSTLSSAPSWGFSLAFNLRTSNSFSLKPFYEFSSFPVEKQNGFIYNEENKTMTYNRFGVAFRFYFGK